ncbi:Glycosylphosphatidylinositol anchor attachment 1 protein [Leucoagaricus sp. SymC.cos]|nr:Glycosylphosphatidylinositol anchor attachment 1 protein [Leucoagaricus sp. SymC.cos]
MENNPPPNSSPLSKLVLRIRQKLRPKENASLIRLQRRRTFVSWFARHLSRLIALLLIVGYIWMLAIPSSGLGRGVYIDENALQPGQVTTYWNWADVHAADTYLEHLESLRDLNATSDQRAYFLMKEFSKLGLSSATQKYAFRKLFILSNSLEAKNVAGTNAYAVLASPRGPRNEAMVISASWLSRAGEGDGTLNLRGVSTVLALARFLRNYSLWAKDIIFVVNDGYLDGMQAWLNAYHGAKLSNLDTEPLGLASGVIWTALNLDYPGHSFSHLGLFFEGLNGRLPNQDLINSVQRIARGSLHVPVTVYDHLEWRDPAASPSEFSFLPSPLRHKPDVKDFVNRAKNIIRHVRYQARGRASGVHGLFHQYACFVSTLITLSHEIRFRIDAITVFAVPATGPHGFHALGGIVESSLRTMNNLLERLHASFFFFILTMPDRFMKIGSYLPSVILISVAMIFRGLRCWVDARWHCDRPPHKKDDHSPQTIVWLTRSRLVISALGAMLLTHCLGALLFFATRSSLFIDHQKLYAPFLVLVISMVPFALSQIPYSRGQNIAPFWLVLKTLNLCLASTVISTITILNFSLAALLAVTLGLPLSLSCPRASKPASWLKCLLYVLLASGWLFLYEETREAIWQWEVLSVWFAPFVCLVYTPLVIQASIVCVLPVS